MRDSTLRMNSPKYLKLQQSAGYELEIYHAARAAARRGETIAWGLPPKPITGTGRRRVVKRDGTVIPIK